MCLHSFIGPAKFATSRTLFMKASSVPISSKPFTFIAIHCTDVFDVHTTINNHKPIFASSRYH